MLQEGKQPRPPPTGVEADRMSAALRLDRSQPTQRSPWRLSGRTTGPPWKPTFADVVEKTDFGDSSRSRVAIGDRDKIAGERLHPKIANWRTRP
jgi:hypothetical protein